tara:strand:+ start:323 stop:511 length:189 start_codon:yes stop_codon:yes gene_type:complete
MLCWFITDVLVNVKQLQSTIIVVVGVGVIVGVGVGVKQEINLKNSHPVESIIITIIWSAPDS